jgi:hypothetical protein
MILLVTDDGNGKMVPREAVHDANLEEQLAKWRPLTRDAKSVSVHLFPYLKHCACCAVYTEKEFLKLPWSRNWEYDLNSYQIHNCTCGSTIGWPVRTTDPDALAEIVKQARGEE